MDEDYIEYKSLVCKKDMRYIMMQYRRACRKLFFHPGCVSKHKIYEENEYVKREGPWYVKVT